MSITQLVQEKMCIYCENQRFRFRILACHFHDSISMDVYTFMICNFGTVLLLGDPYVI